MAGRETRALTDFVTIEKGLGPEGRIAVVRFDRGDGINALSPEALRQLTDAARSFEDDGGTSAVVLTGGAKAFSAGFDLKDAEGRSRATMDLGALRRHLKLGPRLTRAWQEMEQIAIGAIEGFCIGGGVALAVALDFRVMARDAHMRVPEIGLGRKPTNGVWWSRWPPPARPSTPQWHSRQKSPLSRRCRLP
jgi:enoyl-CoA hydratase